MDAKLFYLCVLDFIFLPGSYVVSISLYLHFILLDVNFTNLYLFVELIKILVSSSLYSSRPLKHY